MGLETCKAGDSRETCDRLSSKEGKNLEERNIAADDKMVLKSEEGVIVDLWRDSWIAEGWIEGHFAKKKMHKKEIGYIQKTLHSSWKRKIALSVNNREDYVKHIHREHNNIADQGANDGASGKLDVLIEELKGSERWKAI